MTQTPKEAIEALFKLKAASRNVDCHADRTLKQHSCPINYAQMYLLYSLANTKELEGLSIREIADLLSIDTSNIGRNSEALEDLGLLTKSVGTDDAKKRIISVTELGKGFLKDQMVVLENIAKNAIKNVSMNLGADCSAITENLGR